MRGHWKIYLSDDKIIDNKKVYLLHREDNYLIAYTEGKTDVLFTINRDKFIYSEWVNH